MANARAAKVSMIKLTQRSWTALRTDSCLLLATAETNVNTTAVMLTVSWNYHHPISQISRSPYIQAHLKELFDRIIDGTTPHQALDNGSKAASHQ